MADEPGNSHTEQHAHNATRAGKHHGLDEELRDDVAAFGAERATDADLARALGHARKHDVHNADAADEQRDGGNRAEHDVENLLGPFGLPELFKWNLDVVVLFFMVALHYLFDRVRYRDDLFELVYLDGDFVELDSFLFKTAAAHLPKDFTVSGLGRFQRDEHAVGRGFGVVLGCVGLLNAFANGFHHADDFVVVAANADIPAEG